MNVMTLAALALLSICSLVACAGGHDVGVLVESGSYDGQTGGTQASFEIDREDSTAALALNGAAEPHVFSMALAAHDQWSSGCRR